MGTPKTKKYLAVSLFAQIAVSLFMSAGIHGLNIAYADTSGGGTGGTGGSSGGSSTGLNVNSTFNVKTYLTAEGQNQKYLAKGNPAATFIIQIINFLVLSIGSFAFLALVFGGFTFMTSHGNENLLTKGKDIIKYALTGLAVAILAYYIVAFVQGLFFELPTQ